MGVTLRLAHSCSHLDCWGFAEIVEHGTVSWRRFEHHHVRACVGGLLRTEVSALRLSASHGCLACSVGTTVKCVSCGVVSGVKQDSENTM
jgi:hypothetical protein